MTTGSSDLDDGLGRAIAAAELATEAAQDAAQVSAGHKALIEGFDRKARRMTQIGIGMAGVGALSLIVAGLIYARAVGDLRDAAEVQAAASEVVVERVVQMDRQLSDLRKLAEGMAADREQFALILAGLDARIAEAMAKAAETAGQQSAAMDPQMAAAITDAMARDTASLRDDLLAALAELELSLTAGMAGMPPGTGGGDLVRKIDDLTAAVARLSAAPAAQATAAPSGSASAKSSAAAKPKARPKAQAAPEPSPFQYP